MARKGNKWLFVDLKKYNRIDESRPRAGTRSLVLWETYI